jgi:hypothetical protein
MLKEILIWPGLAQPEAAGHGGHAHHDHGGAHCPGAPAALRGTP